MSIDFEIRTAIRESILTDSTVCIKAEPDKAEEIIDTIFTIADECDSAESFESVIDIWGRINDEDCDGEFRLEVRCSE